MAFPSLGQDGCLCMSWAKSLILRNINNKTISAWGVPNIIIWMNIYLFILICLLVSLFVYLFVCFWIIRVLSFPRQDQENIHIPLGFLTEKKILSQSNYIFTYVWKVCTSIQKKVLGISVFANMFSMTWQTLGKICCLTFFGGQLKEIYNYNTNKLRCSTKNIFVQKI